MLHWTHSDKWQRYNILIKNPTIKTYIPETLIFTKNNFTKLLKKYPAVYLKPIDGTGGAGIIKVSSADNRFTLHYKKTKQVFTLFSTTYKEVANIIQTRPYMVQQGIDLISINDRPIDFRFLLLKPDKEWLYMGAIGKIGKREMIVTNKARGGKPILLNIALAKTLNMSNKQIIELENKLFSLGKEIGNLLSKEFRHVRELGMDIAIDSQANIYVLEINAMPNFTLFKSHKDKSLYFRINGYVNYIRRNYRNKRLPISDYPNSMQQAGKK